MKIRPGTMDQDIVNEMKKDPYLARNCIKNGDIVLDGGANIGAFAKFVLSFAPQAKVICVEPMPSNIEICKYNLKDELSSVLIYAALMGESGTVMIHDFGPTASACHSVFDLGVKNANVVEVPAITLDEVMQKEHIRRIDFLKLDVQGAEFDIIPKCTVSFLDRVKYISMEVHISIAKTGQVLGSIPDSEKRITELVRHLSRTHILLQGYPGKNTLLLWKNKQYVSYTERIWHLARINCHTLMLYSQRILSIVYHIVLFSSIKNRIRHFILR